MARVSKKIFVQVTECGHAVHGAHGDVDAAVLDINLNLKQKEWKKLNGSGPSIVLRFVVAALAEAREARGLKDRFAIAFIPEVLLPEVRSTLLRELTQKGTVRNVGLWRKVGRARKEYVGQTVDPNELPITGTMFTTNQPVTFKPSL